ncbi:Protein CBG18992 [Caenorhabditis briggsae]|uniref:Carboxylic ester hydrolase n=1 Tax=Caenorhabditis briggsae TaxID=6238 RepID=A8XUI7_CAEBR|nr:Protein CBG18992 [Caenorhabditis briggsae]CAP36312.2 Protein CBG18992 [Caenorhabditis briggsae]
MGGYLSHLEAEPLPNVLDASCGPIKGNSYRHVSYYSQIKISKSFFQGDKTVNGYLGIPYAQPPIGPLRFSKPLPADIWTDTRDCTQYGPRCPPSGFGHEKGLLVTPDVPDEANCLSLNVFIPGCESEEYKDKRPVMVYVHGGGFEVSSSREFCAYSMSSTLPLKDVILVTMNYRLGILGFFTTGDAVCPGNWGLWDQTLALKWVKEHIASFGGDPNNVTLFGQSAGGACVDLLTLSPHSRDLFQKIVPMSGSALCEFAMRPAKNQAGVFDDMLPRLGFTGSGSKEKLEFMRSLSWEKLTGKTGFTYKQSGWMSMTPNYDGDFFPKPLDELRKDASKRIMMTGIAGNEGILFAFTQLSEPHSNYSELLKNWIALDYKEDNMDNLESVRKEIFEYYTKNIPKDEDTMMRRTAEYVGDSLFHTGQLATAESAAKYGDDVWFYKFDFCNPNGFGAVKDALPYVAPTHGIELRYLFGDGIFSKFEPTEEELKMLDRFTTMFANFAKYGNPNETGSSKWEKYDPSRPGRHFRISYPDCEMVDEYCGGNWKFLEEIRKKNKCFQANVYGKKI